MRWFPIYTLPNISINQSIEGDFLALVSSNDDRIKHLCREHAMFRQFMNSFYDTFRHKIKPAIIIRRDDAPKELMNTEAWSGFRDFIVAAIVPYAQSKSIVDDNELDRIYYSSYFWIYPWRISQDFEWIASLTPAFAGAHLIQQFRGQASPELSPKNIQRIDCDGLLLTELLTKWTARFNTINPDRNNIALFRSLNIANQASLIPGGTDSTIYDYGRILSLWVSAFEVLVHPGNNGQADKGKIFELLEDIPWVGNECQKRYYWTKFGGKREKRNLACSLYEQLYDCRNKFLHGEPFGIKDLRIPRSEHYLPRIAAILYRLGLTSFLKLSPPEQPEEDDPEILGKYLADCIKFESSQRYTEDALFHARAPYRLHRADEAH